MKKYTQQEMEDIDKRFNQTLKYQEENNRKSFYRLLMLVLFFFLLGAVLMYIFGK